MFKGIGLTSLTCRRSERSLRMVLANTSSLRARWKGSSIIMPAGERREGREAEKEREGAERGREGKQRGREQRQCRDRA